MEKLNKDYFGLSVEITTVDGEKFTGMISDVITAANNPEDGVDAVTMMINGQDTYFPVTDIKKIVEAV